MAIQFLNHISLNDNQLTNAKLHVTGTTPTSAVGQIYVDSGDSNKLKYYDGAWKTIATGTTSLDIDAYTALGGTGIDQADNFVFSDGWY